MRRIQAAALASCVGLGCAIAKIGSLERPSTDERLPKPGVFLVYDFAVTPDDVVVDTLGSEFGVSASPSSREVQYARQVAASLSAQLVSKLLERGINAARATEARVAPMNAMVLKGEFVSIGKGTRAERMVIGLAADSGELRVRAHVYQATAYGLRRVARAEVMAAGSEAPGTVARTGAGGAPGSAATSAVVSGGMDVAREANGGMDADAGRLAEEIADRTEAFYQRQGWL
jgi:hypothetical protein